jgi:hypothetical protein
MMDVFEYNLMKNRCCFDDLGDRYVWTSTCYYGIARMTWMMPKCLDVSNSMTSSCCFNDLGDCYVGL